MKELSRDDAMKVRDNRARLGERVNTLSVRAAAAVEVHRENSMSGRHRDWMNEIYRESRGEWFPAQRAGYKALLKIGGNMGEVKIYRGFEGKFLLETTCTDVDEFWRLFAMALVKSTVVDKEQTKKEHDPVYKAQVLLPSAWLIALKLAGYKSETVRETRLLAHGETTPIITDILVDVE